MVKIIRTCTKYEIPLTFIATPSYSAFSSPTIKLLKKKSSELLANIAVNTDTKNIPKPSFIL